MGNNATHSLGRRQFLVTAPTRGGTAVAVTAKRATKNVVSDQKIRLSASDVYDLLSNARRRYVLCHLMERSKASVRELSRRIAAWENDVEVSVVSSKQRKRVYTALHQTHLPRLDEFGVVEYDRDRGEVYARERLNIFEPYLERDEPDGHDWPRYYAGIGVATMVLAVGIIGGVPVLSAIQAGVAALVVGTAVVLVAAAHAIDNASRRSESDFPDLRPVNWHDEVPADD